MAHEPLPRSLKKAIERLEAEPDRAWRLVDLAAACGVITRTLQKHFQRFLRCTFRPFLRELRFEQARRELLADCRHATVTEIATRCGLAHLGLFAAEYRQRYGESPSSTRRRAERASTRSATSPLVLATSVERPTIAILPFNHVGPQPIDANAFADEIGVARWRLNWLRIVPPPHARYHLRGNVREDGRGGVRVTVRLLML